MPLLDHTNLAEFQGVESHVAHVRLPTRPPALPPGAHVTNQRTETPRLPALVKAAREG